MSSRNFQICDRDDNDNIIDPISSDIIPENKIIFIYIGSNIYKCFDVETILEIIRHAKLNGKVPSNPFTRNEFLENEIDEALEYEKTLIRNIIFNYDYSVKYIPPQLIPIPINWKFGEVIIEQFRQINDLMLINKFDILLTSKSLYEDEYTLETKIKDSNLFPSEEGNVKDINEKEIVFNLTDKIDNDTKKIINLRLNKYGKRDNIEWLVDLTSLKTKMERIFEEHPEYMETEFIDLSHNKIISLEGMPKLDNLIKFDLGHNRITSLASLPKLDNLTYLYLYNNKISTLKGMPELDNLTYLDLGNNQITNLEGMPKLDKLIVLDLGNNQITNLEGMPKLDNLTRFDLYNNKITTLEGMPKLDNLIKLDLGYNKIGLRPNGVTNLNYDVGIEGMPKLDNLTKLFLNNNQITSLEGIPKLDKLIRLDLRNNNLTKKQIDDFKHNFPNVKIYI